MTARVGIAPRGLEDQEHPKCPACAHYMRRFRDSVEIDCASCGCVWEIPQAF